MHWVLVFFSPAREMGFSVSPRMEYYSSCSLLSLKAPKVGCSGEG
jgi:hypothetical protein